MGYDIEAVDCSIILKNNQFVLEICKSYIPLEYKNSTIPDNIHDIVQCLKYLRYDATRFNNDIIHVTDIIHQFRWHGYEDRLWEDLAPYIEDDSYIIWWGEDGFAWEFLFKNNRIEEKIRRLTS